MNATAWIFFLLTIAVSIAISFQAYIPNSNPTCYGSSCPTGTTRCKKHMKSNTDGYMSVTVNCLDEEDGSLKTYFFDEPTTLNRNTKYESTSYTSIGSGSVARTSNGFEGYRRQNNEIDDLMSY